MKERPILFSGPMVRALLAGTKTQTRRVITPAPEVFAYQEPVKPEPREGVNWIFMAYADRPGYAFATSDRRCPYGQPGDRLWVRETFCWGYRLDDKTWTAFPIDGVERRAFYRATDPDPKDEPQRYWTPSIHMPRAACRIVLEITAVRAERLQSISEADAKAEGVAPAVAGHDERGPVKMFRTGYVRLWDELNGRRGYSWKANPWVWVLEFKKI